MPESPSCYSQQQQPWQRLQRLRELPPEELLRMTQERENSADVRKGILRSLYDFHGGISFVYAGSSCRFGSCTLARAEISLSES